IRQLVVEEESTHRTPRAEQRFDRGRHRHDVATRIDDDEVARAGCLDGRVLAHVRHDPGWHARDRCGTGPLADQCGPCGDVRRVEQPGHGYRDEVGVRYVAVAVRIHQAARLGEQEPRLWI